MWLSLIIIIYKREDVNRSSRHGSKFCEICYSVINSNLWCLGSWPHVGWLHLWCMGSSISIYNHFFSCRNAIHYDPKILHQHLYCSWWNFQASWSRIPPGKWGIHLDHGQLVELFIQKMDCWFPSHPHALLHLGNSYCQLVTQLDHYFRILG